MNESDVSGLDSSVENGAGHSPFESTSGDSTTEPVLARQIELLRRNLLDIGTRNRLVSAPLKSSRANVLEIIDEKADHVFMSLWRSRLGLSFVHNETAQPKSPGEGESVEVNGDTEGMPVYVPVDEPSEDGLAARHKDNKLQTRLQAESLQKRLLTLQHDSALFEEEQGANILFLALGFIKWFESDSSDVERFAPILLIPVSLQRDKVRSRFRLERREEDIEVNLSLQAKLKQDFEINLPELPEGDEWSPSDYYCLVEQAISTKSRWSVQHDSMLLGFFSFSKFLLYRDLNPAEWPEAARIDKHKIVRGLLSDGFDGDPLPIAEGQNLDDILDPADLGHVLDADASQAAVVKLAADGHNMVIQGPPGTGKSQTIANVIAAAARDGKSILFVAEKMAALQVVYDRLRSSGLDALCLELHSNKANKKALLDELKRTLDLGKVASGVIDIAVETKAARDRLNHLSKLLHTPIGGFSETPFKTIALLVKTRESGLTPPDFSFSLEQLGDVESSRRAIAALEVLVSRTAISGPSLGHPWRGVRKRLTPVDAQRLRPQLEEVQKTGTALVAAIADGAALFGELPENVKENGADILKWLEHFRRIPDKMRELVDHEALREEPVSALNLLQAADDVSRMHAEVTKHSTEIGIAQDWSSVRQVVAAQGRSLFRFLSSKFRRSVALLDSVAVKNATKTHEERMRRLDSIIALQLSARQLDEQESRGKAVFGRDWDGFRTETGTLRAAVEWYIEARRLPESASLDNAIRIVVDTVVVGASHNRLKSLMVEYDESWAAVQSILDLDIVMAFDNADRLPLPKSIIHHATVWLSEFDRIDEWFGLVASERECRAVGLDPVVSRLASGLLPHERAIEAYRAARAEAIWIHMIKCVPELGNLRGDERTGLVERFRDLEHQLFIATAREIAAKHTAGIPSGAQGQMGYVRGQIARRRGHASIRKLMENAGQAIQKVKPVFLMSPISVAQFLPPGSVSFDFVLMDEASQVRPEDAVGAIARGTSLVVVGDNKQLPPTSFFDRTIGAIENDADDESEAAPATVSAGVMESILTLCQARGLPARTLQWHYRSRHPSLIQVSNEAFYENKLKFPPSPELAGRDGLLFRRLSGVYDRGKTRTNVIEARAVAQAVINHAQENPHISLGVATLSVTQRDAILTELEFLRSRNPDLERFFDRSKEESFFVKNLENVQGDERDVIYISICYARDADGYMTQSLGPVSSNGGERRLNVLFTRARRRCEIFSSISHSDIELRGENVPVGRRVLHTYLKFAETGETDVPHPTGLEADSEFEVAVGNQIRSAGYEVDYQVGSSGFRIDIGVRDPSYSTSYVLGVECDGASYHSALWARERDRLRQQVLESKGWRLHRIWSTDWFHRPDAEFRRLLAAIDAAKSSHKSDLEADQEAREATIKIDRETSRRAAALSVPYCEAAIPRIAAYAEPHLVPPGVMARYVTEVVSVEQPIHTDEVAKRVARAWGAQRVGARIRSGVETALNVAKSDGKVNGGAFWTIPGGTVQVRDRRQVLSTSLRQVDYLPPAELDVAILQSIERSVAITADEAARAVAESLGFSATSAQLKSAVLDRVHHLASISKIEEREGLLRPRSKSI